VRFYLVRLIGRVRWGSCTDHRNLIKKLGDCMKKKKRQFNDILFSWYGRYGRSLPWRKTADPYSILVSEIMLQQTQVSRVLPKYGEFLRCFPTAAALARNSLGAVLRVWSGLGYNRRAKFLWETAVLIQKRHKGMFPNKREELLRLPGVGSATASALLAFSFGLNEPMIDTNVRRVLSRVFFKDCPPSDNALYSFAKPLIPKKKGKEWNWAVIDVGALYCKAIGHSSDCPFQGLHGVVKDFRYKKPPKRFSGSDRFYRGKVMALLTQHKQGYTMAALRRKIQLDSERFYKVIFALEKETLVKKRGSILSLP